MDTFLSFFGTNPSPLIWVYELAAKLSSIDVEEMESHENILYDSLHSVVDLFDLPALCVSFDTTLESTSMGYPPSAGSGYIHTMNDALDIDIDSILTGGRVPQVLSVTSRLKDSLNCAIVGGICSPEILSNVLLSPSSKNDPSIREEVFFAVGEALSLLANSYLESGADGIAILAPDGMSISDPLHTQSLSSLPNILAHYEAFGAIITRETSPAQIKAAADLGFDLITGSTSSPEESIKSAQVSGIHFGLGIPSSIFSSEKESIQTFVNSFPNNTLLSSEWTISSSVSPETIHDLMDSF